MFDERKGVNMRAYGNTHRTEIHRTTASCASLKTATVTQDSLLHQKQLKEIPPPPQVLHLMETDLEHNRVPQIKLPPPLEGHSRWTPGSEDGGTQNHSILRQPENSHRHTRQPPVPETAKEIPPPLKVLHLKETQ